MLKTDKTCSCGNTTHERTLTEDFKFVWECTECHKQSAYRNTNLKKNQKFQEVEVTTPRVYPGRRQPGLILYYVDHWKAQR